MKNYSFKYGEKRLDVVIDETHIVNTLLPRSAPPIIEVQKEIAKVIENPIGTSPLKDIIKPGETVAIIVSDITGAWIKTNEFLIHIIDYINGLGVKDENIYVVIALGTHRPSTERELSSGI